MQVYTTGAIVYLAEYNQFVICDIHKTVEGTFILRAVTSQYSDNPRDYVSGTAYRVEQWWKSPETDTIVVSNYMETE